MEQCKQIIKDMAEQSSPQIDPSKTGLLVIDLVNDGNDDDGAFKTKLGFDVSLLQEIEPKVMSLIEASKKAGMPVIGVQAIYDFDYISKAMHERFQKMGIDGGLALKGSWGSEIIPKIKNAGLDFIVVKSHYSAFAIRSFGYFPGNKEIENYMGLPASEDSRINSARKNTMIDYFNAANRLFFRNDPNYGNVTSLDDYLTDKKINTLIITGASTHVCIDSTIAAASERDYKIFEPIDAVAAEGIPREGFQRHFTYLGNQGMFKAELTTTEKLLKSIQ